MLSRTNWRRECIPFCWRKAKFGRKAIGVGISRGQTQTQKREIRLLRNLSRFEHKEGSRVQIQVWVWVRRFDKGPVVRWYPKLAHLIYICYLGIVKRSKTFSEISAAATCTNLEEWHGNDDEGLWQGSSYPDILLSTYLWKVIGHRV